MRLLQWNHLVDALAVVASETVAGDGSGGAALRSRPAMKSTLLLGNSETAVHRLYMMSAKFWTFCDTDMIHGMVEAPFHVQPLTRGILNERRRRRRWRCRRRARCRRRWRAPRGWVSRGSRSRPSRSLDAKWCPCPTRQFRSGANFHPPSYRI